MSDTAVTSGQIWLDPDDNPLIITAVSYVPPYVQVESAEQDAHGRWRPVDGTGRRVSEEWLRSACTVEPPAPEPPDPRIARLGQLIEGLITEYTAAVTGGELAVPEYVQQLADEIRAAFAEVLAIPEQERRRRHGAARQAARVAFDRGRRAR